MLDMRNLRHIGINGLYSKDEQLSVTIGTGLTWGEVLKYLRKFDKDLITVHGQCTSVGVAGYALHGGVHFGGLSELYGLASDNILAITAVVANGSIVELTESRCDVDGVSQAYSSECSGLWFGLRGAGSSFGVVTSLTLKLHREPNLQSSLSILSLKVKDAAESQKFLSSYMRNIPDEGSPPCNFTLTVFAAATPDMVIIDLFLDSQSRSHSLDWIIISKRTPSFCFSLATKEKRFSTTFLPFYRGNLRQQCILLSKLLGH